MLGQRSAGQSAPSTTAPARLPLRSTRIARLSVNAVASITRIGPVGKKGSMNGTPTPLREPSLSSVEVPDYRIAGNLEPESGVQHEVGPGRQEVGPGEPSHGLGAWARVAPLSC
jgi:hypothetical protein